ncbi:MAG: MBL fold metallo-hydrolase [Clostridiaceae bacterium]
MKIQLIRHGTLLISINNKKILVDPMLSPKGTMSPVPNVCNQNHNPLVELPLAIKDIVNVDAVLLTHTHRDHFDEEAIKVLPKDIPLFCQPENSEEIKTKGFLNVHAVDTSFNFNGIEIKRTKGQHGDFIMSKKMGPVSGYVLTSNNEPSLYIMGDTIWCAEVKEALRIHNPEIAISFSGEAKFNLGGHITMSAKDILEVHNLCPYTKIIAAHLESWNHCSLSRAELKNFITKNGIENNVLVPDDGEILNLK